MKIIRKGKLRSEESAEFTCHSCRSVLNATKGEGKFHSDQRDEDAYEFVCPVCGHRIFVDAKKFN